MKCGLKSQNFLNYRKRLLILQLKKNNKKTTGARLYSRLAKEVYAAEPV